jgi:4'-phosphopantetheinyl transferase
MENPSPSTQSLVLTPQSLHLWLTQLLPYTAEKSVAQNTLSSAEIAHANTFSRPPARDLYLQIRREVRRCLAAHTGLRPQDLMFERDQHGKPMLINAPFPLAFNITHSGDHCAIAVGYDVKVGVDIERPASRRSWPAIAARYFHPQEAARLQQLAPSQGEIDFYRLWTLKEAFFKARGTGISTGLHKAVFAFDESIINYAFAPELGEDQDAWQFWQWRWGNNDSLALACSAPDKRQFDVHIHVNNLADPSPAISGLATNQADPARATLAPVFIAHSRS